MLPPECPRNGVEVRDRVSAPRIRLHTARGVRIEEHIHRPIPSIRLPMHRTVQSRVWIQAMDK